MKLPSQCRRPGWFLTLLLLTKSTGNCWGRNLGAACPATERLELLDLYRSRLSHASFHPDFGSVLCSLVTTKGTRRVLFVRFDQIISDVRMDHGCRVCLCHMVACQLVQRFRPTCSEILSSDLESSMQSLLLWHAVPFGCVCLVKLGSWFADTFLAPFSIKCKPGGKRER